jgi:hypothetical protein
MIDLIGPETKWSRHEVPRAPMTRSRTLSRTRLAHHRPDGSVHPSDQQFFDRRDHRVPGLPGADLVAADSGDVFLDAGARIYAGGPLLFLARAIPAARVLVATTGSRRLNSPRWEASRGVCRHPRCRCRPFPHSLRRPAATQGTRGPQRCCRIAHDPVHSSNRFCQPAAAGWLR